MARKIEKTEVTPSGVRVAKWKHHRLVMEAPTLDAKKEIALALEQREQRRQELAADMAAEALEHSKRSFFGKVFHHVVIFTLGTLPDAVDEVFDFFDRR